MLLEKVGLPSDCLEKVVGAKTGENGTVYLEVLAASIDLLAANIKNTEFWNTRNSKLLP